MSNFACYIREGLDAQTRERWRKACKKLNFYRETQGKRYCVLHYPAQNKAGDFRQAVESKLMQKDFDFRGAYFPQSTRLFKGYVFTADVNFNGAIFKQEADFSKAIFQGKANFSEAIFQETKMESAKRAKTAARKQAPTSRKESMRKRPRGLKDADFADASFRAKADFKGVRFKGEANFRKATFEREADFSKAIFEGEARFRRVTFKEMVEFEEPEDSIKSDSGERRKQYCFNARANFSLATFMKRATFVGRRVFNTKHEDSTFRNALIEKPENFTFDRVQLRPSWFIDTNVQRFRFTDVWWTGLQGVEGSIEEEIDAIRKRREEEKGEEKEEERRGYAYHVLALTCRELSANAEVNRDYPAANEFHYWSMDTLRIRSWSVLYEALLKEDVRRDIKKRQKRDIRFKDLRPETLDVEALLRKDTWHNTRGRRRFGVVNTLYWVLSGYGVRAGRALGVLASICVAFAWLYMLLGPAELQTFWTALAYSTLSLARLNPELTSEELGYFQFLVGLEGILGPLQIALLALAIRRKVMR